MASATLSKFATAVPRRSLLSSTPSSAGAASDPEPSAATPGSLTTTLAPSAAQSSAISRPMPRPAPVTMMDLPSSDLVLAMMLLCPIFLRPKTGTPRHARARPAHPSLFRRWIAGSSPVMTDCVLCSNQSFLVLIRKNDRATGREHAADAVADRNLSILDLRRRDAPRLPPASLRRVHARHAGKHVG